MSSEKGRKISFSDFLMKSDGAVSSLVVLLGFLCATLLVIVVGRNPAGIYKSILQVVTGFNLNNGKWNIRYVGEWLNLFFYKFEDLFMHCECNENKIILFHLFSADFPWLLQLEQVCSILVEKVST